MDKQKIKKQENYASVTRTITRHNHCGKWVVKYVEYGLPTIPSSTTFIMGWLSLSKHCETTSVLTSSLLFYFLFSSFSPPVKSTRITN